MNILAPIVLFVYNRPVHTKKTVEALSKNILSAESNLFIYCDGPKYDEDITKVKEVRSIVKSIKNFRNISIIEREKNLGLANSIISGVQPIIQKHKKVIVLEDDIVTAPNFLSFMNEALSFYEEEQKIFSISGYNFPIKMPNNFENDIYGFYRASSWGWATWFDRWNRVDWEMSDYMYFKKDKSQKKKFNKGGSDLSRQLRLYVESKRDSWFMRFQYSCYKSNMLCVYPVVSKAQNIGTDGSGRHFSHFTKTFNVPIDSKLKKIKFIKIYQVDKAIEKEYHVFFSFRKRIIRRILDFIRFYTKRVKIG